MQTGSIHSLALLLMRMKRCRCMRDFWPLSNQPIRFDGMNIIIIKCIIIYGTHGRIRCNILRYTDKSNCCIINKRCEWEKLEELDEDAIIPKQNTNQKIDERCTKKKRSVIILGVCFSATRYFFFSRPNSTINFYDSHATNNAIEINLLVHSDFLTYNCILRPILLLSVYTIPFFIAFYVSFF